MGNESDSPARAHPSRPALPARWSTALWLVDVNGLQPGEAASMLGMSTPAISALLTRARHALRQQVIDQRFTPPG